MAPLQLTSLITSTGLAEQLKEIDQSISQEADKLYQMAQSIVFEPIMEFELNNNIPAIPETVFKKKGIYFFEIKNKNENLDAISWINAFIQLWKDTDVVWVPGAKVGRLNTHQSFKEWVPLYIGKSKNVGSRIYEHIHQVKDKTTFSMKLKARHNMHGERLKISWFPMDVTNYDMIVPVVERLLRNRFNPITGKQ